MLIKKFKEFKTECELCCEIQFTEDDTYVSNGKTGEDFKMVPYLDWLDLPLKEAMKFGLVDDGNWYSLLFKVFITCPECGDYHQVWYNRLYHILAQPTKEIEDISVKELLEKESITLVKFINYDDCGTKCVYGSEEEVLNERS